MADAFCVLQFSENYFLNNFVLESAEDPKIVLVVCLYLPGLTLLFLSVAHPSKFPASRGLSRRQTSASREPSKLILS